MNGVELLRKTTDFIRQLSWRLKVKKGDEIISASWSEKFGFREAFKDCLIEELLDSDEGKIIAFGYSDDENIPSEWNKDAISNMNRVFEKTSTETLCFNEQIYIAFRLIQKDGKGEWSLRLESDPSDWMKTLL